jgi:pimeloyl-ACP methyl ester carboxylesterase
VAFVTGDDREAQPFYDELGLLHENAAEAGLPFDRPPTVDRVWFDAPSGHRMSGLRWGDDRPEVVLVHGGMQNAHTWDTVALALGRPALAIDLPGHGHSEWRTDKAYRPQDLAGDVAAMIGAFVGAARLLVGMSLGGLTSTVVAAENDGIAGHLALVDITPGVNREKAQEIIDFVGGPETFASFDEILERTIMFNPTRSESSLRRGVLHNARELPDGTWAWRYDLPSLDRIEDLDHRFADLWEAVEAVPSPITLFRGSRSPVVDDADVAELQRRRPDAAYHLVDEAGHSIQGDQPLVLAGLLDAILRAT